MPTLKFPRRARADNPVSENDAPSTPSLRRKPSKKLLWIFSIFALVFCLLIVRWLRSGEVAHDEVKTVQVERAAVITTVSATGTMQAFTTVDVKSKAGGTVLEMAVEEGTLVKKGQLICLIDQQDTSASYQQATADLDAARAALRQSQENLRLQNSSIGPQIQQSNESVNAARASLKQANASLEQEASSSGPQIQQSTAALASTRANLNQAQQALALQKKTSQSSVEEAQSNVKAAQARLEQAQETATSQPVLTQAAIDQASANVAASQASLQSAQETLNLLQTSTQPQETASIQAAVAQAKSDLQTAQTNLKRQQGLLDKGYVAQSVVDTAQNQVVSAQSALRTAQSRLDTQGEGQQAAVRDQQARVAQAKSNVAQTQAALATARANSVQDTLKNKDVASARASLQQSQAALKTATANLQQVGLKQSDVTSAQAAVRQAEAALKSTQAGTKQVGVKAAAVEGAQASVRQATAALKGTQANTIQTQVKAEDVAQNRAKLARAEVTVRNAKENLDQTTVVAPRDGIILQKYVDEGTIVQSGQSGASGGTAIVQLANVSRMYVDVQVDEADISQIKTSQKVAITLDAYPDAPIGGQVRKVYPLAVTESNVTYIHVQAEVNPKDVSRLIRPNMNATCDFLVAEKPNAISVPADAVRDQGKSFEVTVIKDPRKPLWERRNRETRKVEVGLIGDENTEILSGLKVGDTVVTQIVPAASGGASTPSANGSRGGGGVGIMGGGRPPR